MSDIFLSSKGKQLGKLPCRIIIIIRRMAGIWVPLILNTVGYHMSIMIFLIYGSLTLDLSTKSVDILLSRLFQTPIKGLYIFVIFM